MKKTEINVTAIQAFANGLSLGLTDHGGVIHDGTNKDGTHKMIEYSSGSAILSNNNGTLLCGPIDFQAVRISAIDVIQGNDRVRTAPGITQTLAVALLAAMHALELAAPEAAR